MNLLRMLLNLFRKKPKKKERIQYVYLRSGSGQDQIGKPAEIEGRKGRVVDGTYLSITIEFED